MYNLVNEIGQQTLTTSTFLGLNLNEEINGGEFSVSENLSNAEYPVLKPRENFWVKDLGESVQDFCVRGSTYAIIRDHYLYWAGGENPVNAIQFDDTKTQYFVSMGAYLLVFPDGYYFNTEKTTEKGYVERKYNTGATSTTFSLCKQDGSAYATPTVSAAEPDNPQNGDLWIDTTETPHVLKQWSESAAMWVTIPTVYTKIAHAGIGAGLKMYDSVEISGIIASGSPVQDQLTFLNTTMIVYDCGDDYIVVAAIVDQTASVTDDIHVDMTMPKMDFVIESQNRLWGCKYGIVNNEPINEIYASKLGDFRNWRSYMGLSTDSYTVSLGSDGEFTGAINYLGYPLFFKRNILHKIYGNAPSNYQVQTTNCRGVQKESERAMAIIDEKLYYLSETDICVYDGSLPVKISDALGTRKWSWGTFGAVRGMLWAGLVDCTDDNEDNWLYRVFSFDTKKGIWQEHTFGETDVAIARFAEFPHYGGACVNYNGKLYQMADVDTEDWNREDMKWRLVTPRMLYGDDKNTMKLLKVTLRMRIETGAWVKAYVEYDDEGVWNEQREFRASKLGTYILPIFVRKCDHLRVKLEGKGRMALFSINQVYTEGANR